MLRSYFFLLKQNDFQKAILEPIVDIKMILKIRGLGILLNLFIFEPKVEKIHMGVFSTRFVPLISILAPKIMEE